MVRASEVPLIASRFSQASQVVTLMNEWSTSRPCATRKTFSAGFWVVVDRSLGLAMLEIRLDALGSKCGQLLQTRPSNRPQQGTPTLGVVRDLEPEI